MSELALRNIIGISCRRLRTAAGLTQNELIAKCQMKGWMISREMLAKIETGRRHVNDAEVALLADIFGVSADDLLALPKSVILNVARHSPTSDEIPDETFATDEVILTAADEAQS